MSKYFPVNLFVQNMPANGQLALDVKLNNSGYPDPQQLSISMGEPLTNNGGFTIESAQGSSDAVPLQNINVKPTTVNLMTATGSTSNFNISFEFVVDGKQLPQAVYFDVTALGTGASVTSTINNHTNDAISSTGNSISQTVGS